MRLNEISKEADFLNQLEDPAAHEINALANAFNTSASRGYSFNVYHPDKELATFIVRPPGMDIETEEGNLIEYMKAAINKTQHWSFKSWRGDVEEEFAVYVVRK